MHFEIFQGVNEHWYWRLYAENNKKIAFSSQGYLTRQEAMDTIFLVKTIAVNAEIEDLRC